MSPAGASLMPCELLAWTWRCEAKLHEWDDELGELAAAAEDLLTGTRSRDKVNRVRDAFTALDPFYAEH